MNGESPGDPPAQTRASQAWTWVRENGSRTAIEFAANLLLPFLTYSPLNPSLGTVSALMAASVPPMAWTAVEFARRRRMDALSMLVLAGIALSLLAFLGGGDARFLQLREQLVGAAIGLLFLVSAALGRPLIHQLALARMRRKSSSAAQSFEAMRDHPTFRRTMMVMTLVWGIVLIAEAAVCCALVFGVTIERYLLISPIVGYSTLGALTAWSFWYAKRRLRSVPRGAPPGDSG